ncbi:ABC transporter substrate-binding protein [Agrobacterium tumefaciens]|uniref:ABC transporter substrate-binding protein n=1 Tax=Agrobacterium tumefaciens TaxID=358 RepID=UPI003BA3867F
MKQWRAAATVALAVIASASGALGDDKVNVEILHSWTSASESAAMRVLVDAINASGGKWVDAAVSAGSREQAATNRIVGGNPPTAFMTSFGTVKSLSGQGLLRNVDQVAVEEKWRDVLPAEIVKWNAGDGHFYAVQTTIQSLNMMYYSREVLAKSGINEIPKTWDGLFETFDKIRAAGFIPLAQSGTPSFELNLFGTVLASINGGSLYRQILAEKNSDAVHSPEFAKAVEIFRRLKTYTDPGAEGRNWNDTTALVVTNRAAMQFIGEYGRGEYVAAGKNSKTDYGCNVGIDSSVVVLGGDIFAFPETKDPKAVAAQNMVARTFLDKEVQTQFAVNRGSMPARTDLDPAKFDPCVQVGYTLAKQPAKVVLSPYVYLDPQALGEIRDLVTELWSNDTLDPQTFVDEFASKFE